MHNYYRAKIAAFLVLVSTFTYLHAEALISRSGSNGDGSDVARIFDQGSAVSTGSNPKAGASRAAPGSQASQSGMAVVAETKSFLYVGLVEGQWQVFRHDFATGKSEQLTDSTGDKRRPQYHAATDAIYFKDSQGWIVQIGNDGAEARISDKGRIAEFCLIPGADALLYTCLVANNPQRQVLWHLNLAENTEPQLIKRMTSGSLRQIAVKSDREYIVSHIAKRREERLYLLNESEQQGRYITPPKAVSIYPSWDNVHQRVLFASELADGSYDLFALDLDSGESTPFLQTEGASEFTTSVSSDGMTVLVEQQVSGTPPQIVLYNLSTSALTPIQLEHPAKEPFWYQ